MNALSPEDAAKAETSSPRESQSVLVTGAYNYSMASNYNRIPRPPIIEISGGEDRVAVRRETYEDLISLDL